MLAIDRFCRVAFSNALRSMTFRAAMSAAEWSESVRRMAGGRRYRFEFAPYQREMMETPYREDVQMTVYQMASRLGKTEVVMNILGHGIVEAPRRILVLYPTTSQAEKWSKETLEKELCEATAELGFMVRGGRRDSSNTILHKIFPGGLMSAFGGNSPGEMRRAKGNLLFADEIDALQQDKSDEGDQLEIFWMRGSEYPDAIKIAASYPSLVGHSRIADLLAVSDCRKWFTPCARCGEGVILLREHITYPEGEPEKAEIVCPECGEALSDDQRREMVRAGEWRPTQPFGGIAGFWGNGLMSPHPVQKGYVSHLHWIAQQEINASRADNPERARRVLVNTVDALPFQPEQVAAPDANLLYGRREAYEPRKELPDGVLSLKAGVDVQKTWLDCSVWGFGENKESWHIEREQIKGAYDDPATWAKLWNYLAKCEFQHPAGVDLRVYTTGRPAVFVDSSHWGDVVMVHTLAKRALGVFAVQGSPTINAPVVGKRRQNAVPRAWVYPLGVNQAKELLYSRLALPEPVKGEGHPPGFVHFPESASLEFFDGLTAEVGQEEVFRGESFTRYVCPAGRRNEPLDTFVYAYAAMIASKEIPEVLRRRMEPAEDGQPKKRARRRSFIGKGFRP